MKNIFSKWTAWKDRDELAHLGCPGVYSIAITPRDLSGRAHGWIEAICYIGITNARGGLRARLKQFDRTIKSPTGRGHGGARRVRYKYPDYGTLKRKLYVSVDHFDIDLDSNSVNTWRSMGTIAKLEYDCIAAYLKLHKNIPEFNDKKCSPKK